MSEGGDERGGRGPDNRAAISIKALLASDELARGMRVFILDKRTPFLVAIMSAIAMLIQQIDRGSYEGDGFARPLASAWLVVLGVYVFSYALRIASAGIYSATIEGRAVSDKHMRTPADSDSATPKSRELELDYLEKHLALEKLIVETQKKRDHIEYISDDDAPSLKSVVTVLERKRGRAVELISQSSATANSYLIFGTLMSCVGIVFFLFMAWNIVSDIDLAPIKTEEILARIAKLFLDFVPKVAVLAIVQITANFFLKQYKIYSEQARYYDRVARRCESEIVSFLVKYHFSNKRDLLDFAAIQDIDKQIDVLKPDERFAFDARRSEIEQGDLPLVTEVYTKLLNGMFERFFSRSRAAGASTDGAEVGR